jgi:hypothetical protein
MRPLNFFNGWIFVRLKNGKSHHNQYSVTVVAQTKKRALELLREYSPNLSAHHLDQYFSRMDVPPTPIADNGTPTEECILIKTQDNFHGSYVRLTPELLVK